MSDLTVHFISGGLAGVCGTTLTCPLEVVKTRMQSSDFEPIRRAHALGHSYPFSIARTIERLHHGQQPSRSGGDIGSAGQSRQYSSSTNSGTQHTQLSASSSSSVSHTRWPWRRSASLPVSDSRPNNSSAHISHQPLARFSTSSLHSQFSLPPRPLTQHFHLYPLNFTMQRAHLAWHASHPSPLFFLCLRQIWDVDGFRGLFRGLSLNVLGVFPQRAIYFTAYERLKRIGAEALWSDPSKANPHAIIFLSAAGAATISHTLMNPVWFIKTRLQLSAGHGEYVGRGTGRALRNVVSNAYREGGIRAFYRGLTASYLGITETVLTFVLFEWVKSKIDGHGAGAQASSSMLEETEQEGEQPASVVVASEMTLENGDGSSTELRGQPLLQSLSLTSNVRPDALESTLGPNRYFLIFLASGVCKLCSSAICYPHEVLRTRLREPRTWLEDASGDYGAVSRRTLRSVLVQSWRSGGLRSLYAGLGVHLLRQVPNAAIVLTSYELLKVLFEPHVAPRTKLPPAIGLSPAAAASLSLAHQNAKHKRRSEAQDTQLPAESSYVPFGSETPTSGRLLAPAHGHDHSASQA